MHLKPDVNVIAVRSAQIDYHIGFTVLLKYTAYNISISHGQFQRINLSTYYFMDIIIKFFFPKYDIIRLSSIEFHDIECEPSAFLSDYYYFFKRTNEILMYVNTYIIIVCIKLSFNHRNRQHFYSLEMCSIKKCIVF